MYEMYQNHTFLIFEFMYLCNPNIQKEEMYDSSSHLNSRIKGGLIPLSEKLALKLMRSCG